MSAISLVACVTGASIVVVAVDRGVLAATIHIAICGEASIGGGAADEDVGARIRRCIECNAGIRSAVVVVVTINGGGNALVVDALLWVAWVTFMARGITTHETSCAISGSIEEVFALSHHALVPRARIRVVAIHGSVRADAVAAGVDGASVSVVAIQGSVHATSG